MWLLNASLSSPTAAVFLKGTILKHYNSNSTLRHVAHLSQVADLFVSHFHKDLNDEVDSLRRVAVYLSDKNKSQKKM